MADYSKGFQRVNFFTGFQTTADDWNDVIRYDVEKQKLHNRLFHGPGVVASAMSGLKVSARGKADLSVEISPGYAVDGSGNQIYLPEPTIKTISPGDYKLPQTVYLVIKYIEELTDFVSYRANLEYKGHRRVSEGVKIDAIITEPDIAHEVEIARIYLTKGVKRITDAKDPTAPKDNEIDLRYVPLAGVVGGGLSPATLQEIAELIEAAREVYSHMFHNLNITTAADVLSAIILLDMLRRMNLVDGRSLFELWAIIFELQGGMVLDIEANHPELSSKKEFASFKKHIELLEENYKQGKLTPEFMTNIVGYQRKSTENMASVVSMAKKKKKKAAKKVGEEVYEKIKVYSEDFGEKLSIDGVNFARVDMIDVLDKRSEADHKFRIVDARDKYRTRQKLKYPDGKIVEDVGTAYEGGYAEWEVSNVAPNKDLVLVMRMDYVHGDWEAEIAIGGKKVGTMVCAGDDRKFRWRNWPFVIKAEYVTDTFLTIRQTPLTADRDINMFKIWFYQPA